ncbi:MAG: TonB-dependent receptor plug domain-containing protein [Lacibacter sp.]|jgi:TonB-dependent receptor
MLRNAFGKSVLTLLLLLGTLIATAQQIKLSGRVLNQKNEPVAGATIAVSGSTKNIAADVEGRFTVTLEEGKKYTFTVSAVGYQSKAVDEVEVKRGDDNVLTVVMEIAAKEVGEVVIRSTARRENTSGLLNFQRNNVSLSSGIASDFIRRAPDRNTGEVLKRVSGLSVQEGKFLVVRGLADRYNQAMLNGVLLSSTEPDRKTFSFDLFPAGMIDNIIINKTFTPELPGEWAGGLVQVNTKDIPTRNYFTIQAGIGLNTQTVSNSFYRSNLGTLDWAGVDNKRGLPGNYTTKTQFDDGFTPQQKIDVYKQMPNTWNPTSSANGPLNASFLANGGFSGKMFGKKAGGVFGITYSKSNRFLQLQNNSFNFGGGLATVDNAYDDNKYAQDILWGALGNITVQLNTNNKITGRVLFNVNATNFTIQRSGVRNFGRTPLDSVRGTEISFQQNMFFSSQVNGEHNMPKAKLKLKWYGSFNILDNYIPDQRRIQYTKRNDVNGAPYEALISNTLSQESGNIFYQFLNDYIYTGGGDLTKTFKLWDKQQSIKAGYMFQVRDRLFDAKPFSIYLPRDNASLRRLPQDQIFAPSNFGDGSVNSTLFAFDAIKGNQFRYLANTILNAGFIQFDNNFTEKLRVIWGLRVEHFDQLVGSVKQSDPRHAYSKVLDFLPGINISYKLTDKTNLRLAGSQTVIRPEFRELAPFNFYDFELNAAVTGNKRLLRTKATNADLRYEFYPKAGEVFSAGVFYKYFQNPIEQFFDPGAGGASSFSFQNPPNAIVYGAEVEARKKLDFARALKNFTLQANASYIYSRVNIEAFNVNRPLQGQSPYLVNVALLYDLEKLGINATVLYNQIGRRIAFVGQVGTAQNVPAIWEATRPVIDMQVAKKLFDKKGEIRLNVGDLLNRRLFFYQNVDANDGFNKAVDAVRFSRKFGTTLNLTFSYNF